MRVSVCVEPIVYEVPLGNGILLTFPLLLDGAPAAITGWTDPTFVVTTDLDDPAVTPLCRLTLLNGITASDTQSWQVSAQGGTHFAAAALGHYRFAFTAIDPDGQPQTLETGYLRFMPAGPMPA